MSDNPALEAHEHHEHAEHAAEAHDPFISRVSVTIAVLAVITAVTGSLEVTESGGAITAASRAVLQQDRATDSWNAYQAASIKKHLYDLAGFAQPARAADLARQSAKYDADQAKYQEDARKGEEGRERATEESERHEHRHHRLTIAATLLQIGIAISTVAIITRRRPFWYGALGLGALGALTLGSAWVF